MKRDTSEVIAEMRLMADASFVEGGLVKDWADELAAAEPADAGQDAARFGRMVHDLLRDARREEWGNDYFVRQLIKAEDDALAIALASQQAVKP